VEATVILALISAATSAISVLFFALMREKDRQITKLETDNGKLEAKVEQLNNTLGRNTDALEKSNTNTQVIIELLRHNQAGERA
jgi:hypothetical protein